MMYSYTLISYYIAFSNNYSRFGFAHIGRVGSVFATLMVTIERFVAVWCPLSRLKSTKTLLSISIIGSLIYNIPRFLEFQSKTVYVPRHPPSHLEPNHQLKPIPNNSFFNSSKLIDDRTYNSDNFIKVSHLEIILNQLFYFEF